VFLVSGQPPMLGQDVFGEALRMALGNNVIESTSEIEEIVVSGNLAYCRTLLNVTVTAKHDNMPLKRSGHALSILRRCEDGNWRLARDANMVS
jgi:ketosteroid isomerase-like protein